MMRLKSKLSLILAVLVAASLVFVSCQELDTTNFNEPDTDRALNTPEDVEALIGGSFVAWHRTHNRWGIEHMAVMADALTWSWGNYSGQDMSSEPRIAYPNNTSYTYINNITLPWQRSYSALSAATDGIMQINNGLVIGDATRTHRAKAFAKLVQGLSLGYLACFYDRAFILDETVDIEAIGATLSLEDYSDYPAVMDAAIAMLEEAISMFDTGPAFTTPSTWVNGYELSNAELSQVAHSYIARYLAHVARTPAERDAVNWGAVRSHAEQGVQAPFGPDGDGSFGSNWHSKQWFHNDRGGSWGRLDYKMIGGQDKSDGYQNWLNTPVAQRTEFSMDTDDLRFTGLTLTNNAGDEVTGGTYAGEWGPSPFRANRGTYHFSRYGYYRYEDFNLNGNQGQAPIFIPAENDFLIAEAMLRSGDAAGAAALIDKYHVTNGGYPSASGAAMGSVSDARSPLAGSSLWAMLKYEKHIECLMTGAGSEYFDNRGWGDLPSGTPIHAPIPAVELEVLQTNIYTFGGGGEGSVPKIKIIGPTGPPKGVH